MHSNRPTTMIPVDAEMLESIIEYGMSAQIELDTSTVIMDLGTIAFLKILRKNYVLDRLQLQLKSSKSEDIQEFYIIQKTLDGQIAQLSYLIEVNNFNKPTSQEE